MAAARARREMEAPVETMSRLETKALVEMMPRPRTPGREDEGEASQIEDEG